MSATGSSTSGRLIDPTDFTVVRASVANNTVDRLKGIISTLNGVLGFSIPKSGRKADHIRAIQMALDNLRLNNQSTRWLTARAVVRGEPYSSGTSSPGTGYTPVAASSYAPSAHNAYPDPPPPTSYRPIVPPTQRPAIRFKPSPFYVIERALTDVTSPSEVRTITERGTTSMHFSITVEQRSALSANTHQVRFYSTSGQFYSPGFPAVQTTAPIEFPPVVEIRVNGTAVQGANTRGMKKKPGTAPPVDISKLCRAGSNRLDFMYMNTSSPFTPKKYYIVVNYLKYTSINQLVDRLRTGRARSAAEVKNTLWKNAVDDEEIQAGAQTISLKCPLTYVRITTPCRSQACTHGQCFDAANWYTMMEQTTTYVCPVCDKVLNPEELIMDGFFNSILLNTPESVEDIVVEPDAEWHSTDNKHHSLGYRPPRASSIPAGAPSAQRAHSQLPGLRGNSTAAHERSSSLTPVATAPSNSHGAPGSVFIIDSDDEDDQVRAQILHRESQSQSTQQSQSRSGNARTQTSQVIDLTLSSDDEQPASPPRRAPSLSLAEKGKRKAPTPPVPYPKDLMNGNGNDKMAFPNGTHQPSSPKRPRLDDNSNGRGSLMPLQLLQPLGILSTSGDRGTGNAYYGGSGGGHNTSGSLPSSSSFYDRSVSGGQSASTTQRPPHSGVGLRQPSPSVYDPLLGSLRSPIFSSPTSSTSNNLNQSASTRRNDDANTGGRRPSYYSELYGAAPPPSGDSNLYSRGPSLTPPTPNLTNTPPPRSLSRFGKLDDVLRYQSPISFDYQYNYNSPRTVALNCSYDEPPPEFPLPRDRIPMHRPPYDGGGGNGGSPNDAGWSPRGAARRL